jgi:hypothetical protein
MVRQSSEGVGRKEDRRIVEEEEEKRKGGKYRDGMCKKSKKS